MPILQTYFSKFIQNVNPDSNSAKDAQQAHKNIRDYLESDDSSINDILIKSFLYWSYQRDTAIHDIDDVDICLVLNIDMESDDYTPKKTLAKIKKAIKKYYNDVEGYDEDNTDYNRRSILVKKALPNTDSKLSLDIIPAVEKDWVLYVPDKTLWMWIKSNPRWHLEYTTKMNQDNDQYFVKLVKVFKHWKAYNLIWKKHPKWFWVETLIWENWKKEDSYAETFIETLRNIQDAYKNYSSSIPKLKDPGLEWEFIKTAMDSGSFNKFMSLVKETLQKCEEALESDENKAKEIWREIFWEDYFPETIESKNYIIKTTSEVFIRDMYPLRLNSNYFVKIGCDFLKYTDGRTYKGGIIPEKRSYGVARFYKNAEIKFIHENSCPSWTSYLWKVRNYWNEAWENIRGEIAIFTNLGTRDNIETTAFQWNHTVECYAIFQWIIIAKNRIIIEVL